MVRLDAGSKSLVFGSPRRHYLATAMLFLTLLAIAPRAEAAPVLFEFSTQFTVGPLAGVAFSGGLVFDDHGVFPCCAGGVTPLIQASLTLAGSVNAHYELSDLLPGAFFSLEPAGFNGPLLFVNPAALPTGVTRLDLTPQGVVIASYGFNDPVFGHGGEVQGSVDFSFTRLPTHSVPAPGSLLLGLPGCIVFGIARGLWRCHLNRRVRSSC